METLRVGKEEISPTRAIYNVLKPYWKRQELNDQDWAYVLVCLRKIETRCAECKAETERKQKRECLRCWESKLIRMI